MSAKYVNTVPEDPTLEKHLDKQMGCMAGLFQMFDRHPFLGGKRFHAQKSLPAVRLPSDSEICKPSEPATPTTLQRSADNRRPPHSRTQSGQFENEEKLSKSLQHLTPNSWERINARDSSSRLSVDNFKNPSLVSKEGPRFSLDSRQSERRLSSDIRDAIRDSIHKDRPRLFVETKSDETLPKNERRRLVLKPTDSPRPAPLQQPQCSVNSSPRKGQTVLPAVRPLVQESPRASSPRTQPEFDESIRMLARFTELPWKSVEENKDPVRPSVIKDSPRFSYDGREFRRSSSFKMKEAPRFSLDSKDVSRDLPSIEAESEKKRSPSVVARLMGLDEFPTDSTPTSHRRAMLLRESDAKKTSSENDRPMDSASEPAKEDTRFQSPQACYQRAVQTPKTVLSSPCLHSDQSNKRTDAGALRPILTQRCAVEPAPWKHQQDGSHVYPRKAFELQKCFQDVPPGNEGSSQVLYNEIEKRLKQFERDHSGKDLNKQILEAMQQKGLLDSPKPKSEHNTNHSDWHVQGSRPSLKFRDEEASPVRSYKAPIVLIKPAKAVLESQNGFSRRASLSPIHTQTSPKKSTPRVIKDQKQSPRAEVFAANNANEAIPIKHMRKEVNCRSRTDASLSDQKCRLQVKTSASPSRDPLPGAKGTLSPASPSRIPRSKAESEKRAGQQAASPGRPEKQSPKQKGTETENSSPKNRGKPPKGSAGGKMHCRTEPETPRAKDKLQRLAQSIRQHEEEIVSESDDMNSMSTSSTVPDILEQPSPISVLDVSALDKEDSSPSPLKKCLITLKADEDRQYKESLGTVDSWNDYAYESSHDKISECPVSINKKLLQNVKSLVEKLESLGSSEEPNGYPELKAPDSHGQTDEYNYVKEILLASGILCRGFDPTSTNSSRSFPLKSSLFHVLEQKRLTQFGFTKKHQQQGRSERRLVFDTVTEILQRKFYDICKETQEPWLITNFKSTCGALRAGGASGQQLLREVWEELQQLKCSTSEDVSGDTFQELGEKDACKNEGGWGKYGTEMGHVALELERMLFKELVDETLGLLCHKSHSFSAAHGGSTRRQLFFH